MNLTCPRCGYARDLPADRQPQVAVLVTCPQCREQFRFVPPLSPLAGAAALPKAGFWVRLVAAAVDAVLVIGLQLVLGLALLAAAVILAGGAADGLQLLGGLIAWSFGPTLAVAYYVGFTGYCGQTPGKMAVRVKVVRTDGAEIGYGRALLRETVGKFISGLILGIGYLMIAFDEQKQGLHDKIAETYVIKL